MEIQYGKTVKRNRLAASLFVNILKESASHSLRGKYPTVQHKYIINMKNLPIYLSAFENSMTKGVKDVEKQRWLLCGSLDSHGLRALNCFSSIIIINIIIIIIISIIIITIIILTITTSSSSSSSSSVSNHRHHHHRHHHHPQYITLFKVIHLR